MDAVRLGIVGVGNMGTVHARYLQNGDVTRCTLAAACDTDPRKLERVSGIETFADSRDLIRSGLIDAVLIVTPHYGHTTIGIDALEQGLHVLVEKPISVHKADCERLIAAHAKRPELIFSAMFQLRTEPVYRKIKHIVDSGELGPLQRVNWIITNWFRTEAYYSSGGWRATWSGEGGGVLLNQCPHNLDLFQWFCGMPSKLRAFCNFGKYHNIEVEDEVTAYVEYPNGATGVFIASTGEAPGSERLEIAGDRGKLIYEDGRIRIVRNEVPAQEFNRTSTNGFDKPEVWNIDVPIVPGRTGHQAITQNFVDAVLDGTPLIAPAEEGLHSVELANAMIYSSLINDTVTMPLDAAAYEKKLQELIQGSRFEKKVVEQLDVDMEKSYHKA